MLVDAGPMVDRSVRLLWKSRLATGHQSSPPTGRYPKSLARPVQRESFKPHVACVSDNRLVLSRSNRAVDRFVEILGLGLVVGAVLRHQIDESLPADLFGDVLHYSLATFDVIGHEQMTDQEAAGREPGIIESEVADLRNSKSDWAPGILPRLSGCKWSICQNSIGTCQKPTPGANI